MKGVNKVILLGNVGKDPEVHDFDGTTKVAKFSLATSELYRDDAGQAQSHTEWHNIILWRNLAEVAEKYIHKGSLVYIEGKIKTRSYISKDGNRKYVTEIIGEQVTLLDKKSDE